MDNEESGPNEQKAEKTTDERSGPSPSLSQPEKNSNIPGSTNDERRGEKTVNWPAWVQAISGIAIVFITGFYTYYASRQVKEMRNATSITKQSADAAKSAADTAAASLVLGERPWVKITHRILIPLTFNIGGRATGIPTAMMTLEDTIENVGQSPAINVLSWEDVIPMDLDHSSSTARLRQKKYCDVNRHPDDGNLSGYTLFPHDSRIEYSVVGPQMPKVAEATIHSTTALNGKVAFVLVGCVFYRSTFEKVDAPTHQTRFIYYLGAPQDEGGFQPYIVPQGTANELRLIDISDGFTAD